MPSMRHISGTEKFALSASMCRKQLTLSPILPGEEGVKAFFKKSLSWRRTFTSRRSLRSSSRSSVVRPSRSPWWISACLIQVLKELPETPSSLAICEMDLPEEWTSRTASVLNSGGYCGFVLGTQNSFPRTYYVLDVQVSVVPGQLQSVPCPLNTTPFALSQKRS